MKWLWRFPHEQDTLWAKIIKSKYGLDGNKWDSGSAKRCTLRSPWKSISSLYVEFWPMVRFKVGNGRRIRFWEDVWWGEVAFSIRFPDLYRLSRAQNRNIGELLVNQSGTTFHGWDLHFYRDMHVLEIQNFATMSVILDQVRLNGEMEDIRIWNQDRSGGFSCKSAIAALQHDENVPDFPFYQFVWKSNIPTRIRFFAWSLSLEKINTFDILQKKRPFMSLNPSWCVMCKQNQESALHLFLQCDFATHLWAKVFSEFRLSWEVPNNLLDLLKGCLNVRWSKTIKKLWVTVVWAVSWGIWRERNSRIFKEEYESVFNLWDKILYWVAIWVKSCKHFTGIPFSALSMGWSFLL